MDLTKGGEKIIFWRKVIRALKDLKTANKDMFDHTIGIINPINDATQSRGALHWSLMGKPAPEVVMVFRLLPVWPLVPGT